MVDAIEPEPVGVDALDALDASPQIAAAAVHHAPSSAVAAITTELASRAALHPDAHVAKYTLACFDAAAADPDHHAPVPLRGRVPARLVVAERHRQASDR